MFGKKSGNDEEKKDEGAPRRTGPPTFTKSGKKTTAEDGTNSFSRNNAPAKTA